MGADELQAFQLGVLVEAMMHPLRGRVLCTVGERPGATIKQISGRLDESPRRVRGQLDHLVAAGLVTIDGSTPRRNARERHYRATEYLGVNDEESARTTSGERRRLALGVLRMLVDDMRRATSAGTLGAEQDDYQLRIPGEVDDTGWEELTLVLRTALVEIEAAMRRSARRLDESGERGTETVAGLLLLEVPPWASQDDEPPASLWRGEEPPARRGFK